MYLTLDLLKCIDLLCYIADNHVFVRSPSTLFETSLGDPSNLHLEEWRANERRSYSPMTSASWQ